MSLVIVKVSCNFLSEHQCTHNYGLVLCHKSLCVGQVIFTFSHKIAYGGEALGKSMVLDEAMRMGSHNGITALRKKES